MSVVPKQEGAKQPFQPIGAVFSQPCLPATSRCLKGRTVFVLDKTFTLQQFGPQYSLQPSLLLIYDPNKMAIELDRLRDENRRYLSGWQSCFRLLSVAHDGLKQTKLELRNTKAEVRSKDYTIQKMAEVIDEKDRMLERIPQSEKELREDLEEMQRMMEFHKLMHAFYLSKVKSLEIVVSNNIASLHAAKNQASALRTLPQPRQGAYPSPFTQSSFSKKIVRG